MKNHLQQAVTIPTKARICGLYSTDDIILDQLNVDFDTSASECDEYSFLKLFQHIKDTLPEEIMDEMLGPYGSGLGSFHIMICILLSRTHKEHIFRSEAVFEKLNNAGFKLNPSKCHCLRKQKKFVGKSCIRVDPDIISCVKDLPFPKTVLEVQHFVGLTSF